MTNQVVYSYDGSGIKRKTMNIRYEILVSGHLTSEWDAVELLSVILQKSTGMTAREFANENLFAPRLPG
jgi:hypothetical protein